MFRIHFYFFLVFLVEFLWIKITVIFLFTSMPIKIFWAVTLSLRFGFILLIHHCFHPIIYFFLFPSLFLFLRQLNVNGLSGFYKHAFCLLHKPKYLSFLSLLPKCITNAQQIFRPSKSLILGFLLSVFKEKVHCSFFIIPLKKQTCHVQNGFNQSTESFLSQKCVYRSSRPWIFQIAVLYASTIIRFSIF